MQSMFGSGKNFKQCGGQHRGWNGIVRNCAIDVNRCLLILFNFKIVSDI